MTFSEPAIVRLRDTKSKVARSTRSIAIVAEFRPSNMTAILNGCCWSSLIGLLIRRWRSGKRVEKTCGIDWRLPVVTREDAIYHASHHCKSSTIQGDNTRFSNINARKDVWWIDIPAEMITGPTLNLLNLLLCDTRPSQIGR